MRRHASVYSFRLFGIVTLIVVGLSAGIAVAHIRSVTSVRPLERSGHTATLLSDGRVLIAGGERNQITLARSEMFDPATKATRPGPLGINGRADHTATLLEDGRVLIAGGRNGQVTLESVEIYDPLTDSFAHGGHLTVARSGHVSVALQDGRVLLAGGDGARTAELFDGRDFTRLDTPTNASRRGASATLLSDGRVVIIGGRDLDGEPLATAEVFDPVAGTFRGIGSMRNARVAPMLVPLPDGKVQVLGGDADATMEIFTPLGDRFTAFTILRALDENVLAKTPARFATRPSSRVDVAVTLAGIAPADVSSSGRIVSNKSRTGGGGGGKTAWVTTDKADYAPGERVTVTGGNFGPNETVTLVFERNPETSPTTTLYARTDSKGNFTNDEYVCVLTDLGVTFTLTATGQSSGRVAITSFTDGISSASLDVRLGDCSPSNTRDGFGKGDTVCAFASVTTNVNFLDSNAYVFVWKWNGAVQYTSSTKNAPYWDTSVETDTRAVLQSGNWTVQLCDAGTTCSSSGNTIATLAFTVHDVFVHEVTPGSGPSAGGTSSSLTGTVSVTGTGFTDATAVTFRGVAATNVTVVSPSEITCTPPPQATAGGLSPVVTTPVGTSPNNFYAKYFYVTPSIGSVSPSAGPVSGGTPVTIHGENFGAAQGDGSVAIGGVACVPTAWSNSSITCITGFRTAGDAQVVVTANGGAIARDVYYTYVVAPVLFGISPASGSTLGGQQVTVSGLNFTAPATVEFDGVAATSVVVVGPTTITCVTPPGSAGPADLLVRTPGGGIVLRSAYTYILPPADLTSVSPASGSTAGGQAVTITGTNLTGATSVTFGGAPATSVVVVNDTTITCVTPARPAGTASVLVTTAGGTNAANTLYTYVNAPTVTSVSPAAGPAAGGQSVTITGTNLTGATGVTFGGAAATSVVVVNATTITCVTPARPAGPVSVLVTTGGGPNAANTLYTYVAAPTVTSVSPAEGPAAGGQAVTIAGANLTGATDVTFGGAPATNVVVVNATTITCVTPPGAPGTVSVLVTTAGGTNTDDTFVTDANLYTYIAAPAITSISPFSGPTAGGTSSSLTGVVTLTGTNFTADASCRFGLDSGPAVAVVSSTTITCRPPAVTSAGPVNVTVTTAGGTSGSVLYTYTSPSVTSISPSSGSTLGGTQVVIGGSSFGAGQGTGGVAIGGVACAAAVWSDSSIECTTGARAAGLVNLVVTANGGASGLLTNAYTYVRQNPVLTISPVSKVYTASSQTTTVNASVAGAAPSDVKYTGTNGTVYITSTTGPTSVGDYNVTADFTPTDGVNYNVLSDAAASNNPFQITRATPTFGSFTYANGFNFTYNGSAQGAITATVVGVGAETSLVPASGSLSIGYYGTQFNGTTYGNSVDPIGGVGAATTPPTNGGNYTAYLRYTDTSGNYENAFATRTFNIVRASPQAVLTPNPTTYFSYDGLPHTYANVPGSVVSVTGVGGAVTLVTAPNAQISAIMYHGIDDDACTSGIGWAATATAAGGYTIGLSYSPTLNSTDWNNYNPLTYTNACYNTAGCTDNEKAGRFIIAGAAHAITGTFTTNAPYDGVTQLGVPDTTVAARHVYAAPHALAGQKTDRELRWQTYDATLGDPGFNMLSSSPYCIIQGTPALDVVTGTTTAAIRFIHANSSAAQCTIRAWYAGCDFNGTVSVAQAVRIFPAQIHIDWAVPQPITTTTALNQIGTPVYPSVTDMTAPYDNLNAVAYWVNNQTGTPQYHRVSVPSDYAYGELGGPYSHTYTYYPPAGSYLRAGNNQDLSLAFATNNPDFISPRAANQFINVSDATRDDPPAYCDTYHYATRPARSFAVGITSGLATATSAGNLFVATDVGSTISGTGIPAGTRIVAYGGEGSVTMSANATATATPTATLTPPAFKVLGTDGPMRGMVAGDFNGDGKQDFIVANKVSLAFYEGHGDGSFKLPVAIVSGFSDLYEMVTADFNGDNKPDIAVTDAGANAVYVYTNNGLLTPTFILSDTLTSGVNTPYSLVAANLNGGAVDLVVTNNGSNTVQIWTGAGNGTFSLLADAGANSATYALDAGARPWGVVTGEFTGDAHLDVMVALNGTTNSVAILTGDGTGRFESLSMAIRNVNGPHPRTLAAADLDGDGRTDVLVGNYGNPATTPTGTVYKMMNTGGGNFSIALAAAVVRPSMIVIGDILAEGGARDFGVVSQSANALFLFKGNSTGPGNYTATAFKNNTSGVRATGTSPYALVIDDFDGDNRLDIVTNGTTDLKAFAANIVPTATITSVKVGTATTHAPFGVDPIVTGGDIATLTVTLAGTGPYVVKWNDGTSQSTSLKTLVRNVKPAATTVYSITSVTGASACAGAGGSSVTLTP
jgi:hypothetical protein